MTISQPWPKRLWLVRHGQSQGNVARDAAHEDGSDNSQPIELYKLGHTSKNHEHGDGEDWTVDVLTVEERNGVCGCMS